MPSGIGVYIRHISKDKYGTPKQAAEKVRNAGVSFVAILSVWQEAIKTGTKILNKPNSSKYAEYVAAFTEAGINVWLWGYPWNGKESGFVTRINQAIERVPGHIKGILLDPELGYKWQDKLAEKRVRERAGNLITSILDLMNESMNIGVTSYGQPKVHKNFPWEEFTAGFGSPQFYTVGKNAILAGLKQWRELGFTSILPSVPAFGKNGGENLENYLRFFPIDRLDGFIVWSWPQMQNIEWSTIERWAARF